MSDNTNQFTAKMILEKTTPGALFYREVDDQGRPYPTPNTPGAKIGTQYIRKSAFNGYTPKEITVTVAY